MSFTENKQLKIGLVIMASGLSRRFGRNKLIEPLCGKPLIEWITDKSEGLFDRRIVVTRSEAVRDFCTENGIDCIFHELPHRNDTVRLGLEAIMADVDYCFFSPADQPLIKKESLEALVKAARDNTDKIVRPRFKENVGSPMGFPRRFFEELCRLPESKGGNHIAKGNPEAVFAVDVQNEYELIDIDTVSDLETVRELIAHTL